MGGETGMCLMCVAPEGDPGIIGVLRVGCVRRVGDRVILLPPWRPLQAMSIVAYEADR